MTDWLSWHEGYDRPGSSLTRRLGVVRRYIKEALSQSPAGPILAISMCAGDGRDLLGVLSGHPRGGDVAGRLVELDPQLAHRARASAPASIEVVIADAGASDSYVGVTPADLVLACGIFGNVSERDIRNTIESWVMLCRKGGHVIWTRGASEPDLRDTIPGWVVSTGFEEIAFDGHPEKHGVGMARMARDSLPLREGLRIFEFLPGKAQADVSA